MGLYSSRLCTNMSMSTSMGICGAWARCTELSCVSAFSALCQSNMSSRSELLMFRVPTYVYRMTYRPLVSMDMAMSCASLLTRTRTETGQDRTWKVYRFVFISVSHPHPHQYMRYVVSACREGIYIKDGRCVISCMFSSCPERERERERTLHMHYDHHNTL
jgi:hypothetical protein